MKDMWDSGGNMWPNLVTDRFANGGPGRGNNNGMKTYSSGLDWMTESSVFKPESSC